jgi:hypothetical protein
MAKMTVEKNGALREFAKLIAEAQQHAKKTEVVIEADDSLIRKASEYLDSSRKNDRVPAEPSDIESQRWADPLRPLDQKFVTFKEMNDHYGLFLKRIQQQMSTVSGGGEVRFLRLDDVASQTATDKRVLEYDAATGKIQFTNKIEQIDLLRFDTSHIHDEVRVPGTLCWSQEDDTLNLTHPGGVVQQIGQETYAYVRNRTGATIGSGSVVRFDGAEDNGTARLLVAPFLADGTFPSLYGLGVATQDIEDGADGKVTVWGKVRDLDTSAWNIGDILYVSANTAGEFTNVKPTAPSNVIPIAAVLRKDTTDGEIFVRPTIEQQQYYGRFARTSSINVTATNTANTIQFDTTEISNGVTIDSANTSQLEVVQSGLYQVDVSAQIDASGGGFSSGTMYMWILKNGTAVDDSTRRQGVLGAAPSSTLSFAFTISLDAGDKVAVGFAGDSTNLLFSAAAATAFAPRTAAVLVGVTQIQL